MGNSSGKDAGEGGGVVKPPKGPLTYNPNAVGLENHYISVWSGDMTALESIVKSLGNVRGTQSIFSFIVYLSEVPSHEEVAQVRSWCASQKTTLYELPGATKTFVISPALNKISEKEIRFALRIPSSSDENMEHVFYMSTSDTVTGNEALDVQSPRLLSAVIHASTGTILFTQPSPDITLITNFQMFSDFPAFKAVSLYPFTVFNSSSNVTIDYNYCMAYRINSGDINGFVKLTNSAKKALNDKGTSLIVSVASWPNKNLEEYAYAYMNYTCEYMGFNFNKYVYDQMVYVYNRLDYSNGTVHVPGMAIRLLKNAETASPSEFLSFHVSNGTLTSTSLVRGIVSASVLYAVNLPQASGSTVYVWNGNNGAVFDPLKGGDLTVSYTEITDKMLALKYVSALPQAYPTALLFSTWSTLFSTNDITQLLTTLKNYKSYTVTGTKVGGMVHNDLITSSREDDNYIGKTAVGLVRLTTPKKYTESDLAVLRTNKFDNCSSNRIIYYGDELCFKNTKNSSNCTVTINGVNLNTTQQDLDTGSRIVFVLCRKATMADVIDAFDYIQHYKEYKFIFIFTANRINDTTDFFMSPLTRVILELKCDTFQYSGFKGSYQMYEYVFLKPLKENDITLGPDADSTGLILTVMNKPIFALSNENALINHESGQFNTKINTSLAPVIALISPDYVKSTDEFTLPENVKSTGIEYIYQEFNEHLSLEDNTSQGNRVLDRRRTNLFSISSDSVDVFLNGRIFEYFQKKNNGIIFNYIRKCTLVAFQKLVRTIDELLENFTRFDFAIVILFEREESKIEIPSIDPNSIFQVTKVVPIDDTSITFITILPKNITAAYTSAGLEVRSSVGEERFLIVPKLVSVPAKDATTTVFLERYPKTKQETISIPIHFRYTFIEEPLFRGLHSNVVLIERNYTLTYNALIEPRNLYKGHPVYYNTMNFDELYGFIMHIKNQLEIDSKYEFTCIVKLVPKRIGAEVEGGQSSIVHLLNIDTWGIPEVCRVYKFSALANICVFTTEKSSQAFSDGFGLTALDRRFVFVTPPPSDTLNKNPLPIISQAAYTKYQQNRIDVSIEDLSLSKDTPIYVHQYTVDKIQWYTITRKYSEATAPVTPELVLYTLNSILLLPVPKTQVFPIEYKDLWRSAWLPRLYVYLTSEPLYINTLVKYFYDHADENKNTQFIIGPLTPTQYNIIQFPATPTELTPQIHIELVDNKNNLYMLIVRGAFCDPLKIQTDTTDQNILLDIPAFSFKFAESYTTNMLDGGTFAVYLASKKGCTNAAQPGECGPYDRKIFRYINQFFLNFHGFESCLYPIKEYSNYPHIEKVRKLEIYLQLTFTNPKFAFMDTYFDTAPANVPFIFVWEHKTMEPPLHALVRRPEYRLPRNFIMVVSNTKMNPVNLNFVGAAFKITTLELISEYLKYCIVAHTADQVMKNDTRKAGLHTYNFILCNGKPVVNLYYEYNKNAVTNTDYNGVQVPRFDLRNFVAYNTRWNIHVLNIHNITCRLLAPVN